MNSKYRNESLLEKLADTYQYNVGPVKVESPFEIKIPFKRKDTRAFATATALGHVASRYNRARINNGKRVGDVGRFMAENPGATMLGANVIAGLGIAGKETASTKLNERKARKAVENIKVAENQRSEFEKYASHGFLTSKETQDRFLENHKPSDLALVKLAFALEACGELDKIDHLLRDGGDKVLDDYMKVAYDVCSEGIEKEAGAVRRALVNGAAGFLSGGAINLPGSIPNAVATSALGSLYSKAGAKATEFADKGLDAGIDKVIKLEDKVKRNKVNNFDGMSKAASYNAIDAQAEIDKLDQAFLARDAQAKAAAIATEYEKIAAEKEALDSLLGNKIANYIKEEKAIQEFDNYIISDDEDKSDVGLEDEIKLANDPEPEDSLESAVTNMDIESPSDSVELDDLDKDNDSIWNEDPSDLIE